MNRNSYNVFDQDNMHKTPGQLLREQRLKLAIEKNQAADCLNITRTKLEAIEADDYSVFSSVVYIRGHLRNYARLVNVSDAEIIDCYSAYAESQSQSTPEKAGEVDESTTSSLSLSQYPYWRWLYFSAAALILLWTVVYPFIGHDSQRIVIENAPVFEYPVTAIDATQAKEGTESKKFGESSGLINNDSFSKAEIDSASDASDGKSVQMDMVNSLPVTTELTSVTDHTLMSTSENHNDKVSVANRSVDTLSADEIDQLVLSFSDDCWLEVTDAAGTILAAKLHRAGDKLVLRGSAPFSIMLGNVKAAELRLNGKAVAVTPIGSRRTLRFKVDNT